MAANQRNGMAKEKTKYQYVSISKQMAAKIIKRNEIGVMAQSICGVANEMAAAKWRKSAQAEAGESVAKCQRMKMANENNENVSANQ